MTTNGMVCEIVGGGVCAGGRIVGLDLMRLGLALQVFIFHSWVNMRFDAPIISELSMMGATAMTGFFLLSGFVLHSQYVCFDISTYDRFKRFLLKRVATLYPCFLFVVFVYCLLNFRSLHIELFLFPIEVLGISTVFSSLFSWTHNGGTWFISCILLCYISFPCASKLLKGMPTRVRLILLLVMVFLLLYSPVVAWKCNLARIYDNPFFRFIEFFLGMIFASFNNESALHSRLISIGLKKLVLAALFWYCSAVIIGVRNGIFVRDWMMWSWVGLPAMSVLLIVLSRITVASGAYIKLLRYCSELSYPFFLGQLFCFRVANFFSYA